MPGKAIAPIHALYRFALAAAAVGLMSYEECMHHEQTVVEVAALAETEGKSTLMAVLYDEMIRPLPCQNTVGFNAWSFPSLMQAALGGSYQQACFFQGHGGGQ